LEPQIRRASNEQFHFMMKCWREAARHTRSEDQYERALVALLPRSYPDYCRHLLDSGETKRWVDFHLLNGISPQHIHPADLKTVEQSDAGLLLPLYHQAVEKYIGQKNRTSYREAVK